MKLLKMKTSPIKASVIAFLSCVVCLLASDAVAEPKTIYVDQKVETPGDGLSWKTAVKTIQEGVNKASKTEVDTILVAPGEYADEPGYYGSKNFYYRIKLDRKVILKSSEGKEVTHIVGRLGDGLGGNGVDGKPPVTCVYIPDAGHGSIVEGFTIRDGEAPNDFGTAVRSAGVGDPTKAGNDKYYLNLDPEKFWYVAYCTVSNCCAGRGSAVSGGTLINSVIADNRSFNSTVATTYVHAYNCLFTRNSTTGRSGAQAYALVNCLVVDESPTYGMTGVPADQGGTTFTAPRFCNSAIYNQCGNSTASWGLPVCLSCVVDANASGVMNIHADSENVTPIRVSDKNYTAHYTNLVMSAMTGDYRPVKGGFLDGTGNRDFLALDFIPEQYRNRDFNGNLMSADAPVPIGLVLPAAEPATAPLVVGNGMKLNGHLVRYANHAHYGETWPSVVSFSAEDGKKDLFVGLSVNPYAEEVGYRKFCGKYDSVPLTLPPREDADGNLLPALGVSKLEASADCILWVDDDAEFEGNPDGSFDRPYRKIQDAVTVAIDNKKFYIIKVRQGTYNTGSSVDSTGLNARVVVSAAGNLLIRGVDGADVTFVEGEPDPSTLQDETNPGIGPNACRCFWLHPDSNVAMVDLTIRKGYGGLTGGTGSGGGAVCGNNKQQFYDCVFTDNHIVREATGVQLQGSCCLNGWLVRCVLADNLNYNRGVISKSTLTACQIVHNARGCADNANAERYVFQEGNVYQTTIYEPDTKNNSYTCHTSARAENCVIVGGDLTASSDKTVGMWIHNVGFGILGSSRAHPADEIVLTDPWLAAVERYDFHPVEGSPVLGFTEFSNSATRLGARLRSICTDFENKSVFTADGRVTIGAFATMHEKANVYVDATNGDDENDGSTEELAKKTLAAAVAAIRCRKDGVIALPGTYSESNMIHSVISSGVNKPLTVRARVVVPDGATLASRDGAETTIIEGEPDPNPTGTDGYGLGPNAMRGVVLGKGSVLRGFTVTKGRTAIYDKTLTGYSDNIQGAGVLGRSPADSRAEDCIFTGNYGDCGGGGAYVTFDHCKIVGNRTTRFGSFFRCASAVNCYIDGNWGDRVCESVYSMYNCTFGPSNLNPAGTDKTMVLCQAGNDVNPVIRNVLSLSPSQDCQINGGDIRNCVLPQGMQFTNYTTLENVNTDLPVDALQALYDANGYPKSVRGTPSVDTGLETAEAGETDFAGNPRVLNGTIDIGCYEADWKGQYAKDLGGRRATVTAATTNVRDVDGEIVLVDGAGLALELAAGGFPVKIEFTVTDGTLTVMRGGEVFGTYTAGQTLSLNDTADLENFAFSYEGTGDATLACCKAQPGAMLLIR